MMRLTCQVCSDTKTNGYHFGAFTCEGCKSFFGRNKHLSLEQIEACKNGGSCTITQKTRAICKYCRFQKCLRVGMSKEKSTYGRRSNTFKLKHFARNQQGSHNTHERQYLKVPNVAAIAPRSFPLQSSIHEGSMPSARRGNQAALNRPRSHDSLLQAMVPRQFVNDQHRRHSFSSEEPAASTQQQSPALNVSTPSTSRNTSPPSVVSATQQYTPAAALPNLVFPSVDIQLLSRAYTQILLQQCALLANAVNVRPINELIQENPPRDVESYSNQVSLSTPSTESSGTPTDSQINLSCKIVSEPAVAESSPQSAVDATQIEPLNLSVHNERRMQNRGQKRKRKVSEKHDDTSLS